MKSLFPHDRIKSAYDVDYIALKSAGIKAVFFDIDNTLVEHGFPADERAINLFDRLKKIGFDSTLLSNNKEGRVKSFNDAVNVNYIFKAGKPSKKGYMKAMQIMQF